MRGQVVEEQNGLLFSGILLTSSNDTASPLRGVCVCVGGGGGLKSLVFLTHTHIYIWYVYVCGLGWGGMCVCGVGGWGCEEITMHNITHHGCTI